MQTKDANLFFSSPSSRHNLYYCNAVDDSILPDSVSGKIRLKPGLAVYKTKQEYEKIIRGDVSLSNWPVGIFFRTDVKPRTPDGLPDDACYWGEDPIEVEIVAYSKDYGESFMELDQRHSLEP